MEFLALIANLTRNITDIVKLARQISSVNADQKKEAAYLRYSPASSHLLLPLVSLLRLTTKSIADIQGFHCHQPDGYKREFTEASLPYLKYHPWKETKHHVVLCNCTYLHDSIPMWTRWWCQSGFVLVWLGRFQLCLQ